MGVSHEELQEIQRRYMALDPDERRQLVSYLLFYFSEEARASYVDAGNPEGISSRHLRAFNEVVQVLSKQMLVAVGAKTSAFAYPDDVLFQVVVETVQVGGPGREAFLGPVYRAFREVLRS
jgi:hypothetical protein